MRALSIVADVVAISALTMLVYFPRHRRRDMLLSYAGANVGVMAVTIGLEQASIAAGLGLGLFGVLSIIRLRSRELGQIDVAYYFTALAMGLVGGLQLEPAWVGPALIAGMLLTVWLVDHPRLFAGYRTVTIDLDTAYTSEADIRTRLAGLLGAEIARIVVLDIDLVRDTTRVDVRYRLPER